jgi:hypothetical protein
VSKDPDFISTAQFMTLPLELKQRWWDETDHGRKPVSDELKQAILAAVGKPEPDAA